MYIKDGSNEPYGRYEHCWESIAREMAHGRTKEYFEKFKEGTLKLTPWG